MTDPRFVLFMAQAIVFLAIVFAVADYVIREWPR